MLGRELSSLGEQQYDLVVTDIPELDVSDQASVDAAVAAAKPDLILHGGAITNVDGCETDPDLAYRVNSLGTRNMAQAAAHHDVPILYVSTDYVFDGDADHPYLEFDHVNPRSVYGKSKLAGEQFVREIAGGCFWILRTQWIYGFHGKNFVDTILAAARDGRPLRVVDDQIGCPTFARDLARGILEVFGQRPGFGTYHCSASGQASWFDFTREILRVAGVTPKSLDRMPSTELDRPAPRPARSVLRNFAFEQSIGDPMRSWQEGLSEYLAEKATKGP